MNCYISVLKKEIGSIELTLNGLKKSIPHDINDIDGLINEY